MKRALTLLVCLLPVFALAVVATVVAQGQFEVLSGKQFDQSVPGHFYLEGQAIPVQKRNAALIKGAKGTRVFAALLDTSGYGADITQKYVGMMITEGKFSVCGKPVEIGSYGVGLKTTQGSEAPATFFLYNQAGGKVLECQAPRDNALKQPKPLQVVPEKTGTARLYIGRHYVELK